MDHALGVGIGQRAGGRAGDAECLLGRELPLALETVPEILPLDERHGEPELAGHVAGIEHAKDVGVLEARGETDLPREAVGAQREGQLRVQHLERHLAAAPDVARQVDGGHAAAAELALEEVAAGEGRAQILRH